MFVAIVSTLSAVDVAYACCWKEWYDDRQL